MATNGRKGSFELGRKAVKELRRKKLWRPWAVEMGYQAPLDLLTAFVEMRQMPWQLNGWTVF
ncbi:hypothetical protein Csa_023285 [Cucumis sativus]|uniref:Uncharacterized protein n=1 Tax=Cucumis sativus TaxID=3659 RepID=A0A0A0LV28_CUCSA|nr:hypothetical protein Csa_023285 [Cucumis sativus]